MQNLFSVEDEIDFSDDDNFLQVNLRESDHSHTKSTNFFNNQNVTQIKLIEQTHHPTQTKIGNSVAIDYVKGNENMLCKTPVNEKIITNTSSIQKSASCGKIYNPRLTNSGSFKLDTDKISNHSQLKEGLDEACNSADGGGFFNRKLFSSPVTVSTFENCKNTKRLSNQSDSLKEPSLKKICSRKSIDCIKKTALKTAKFPGPAGMLPKLNNISDLDVLTSPSLIKVNSKTEKVSHNLLNRCEDFSQMMWEECQSEFKMLFPDCFCSTISSILYDAANNKLENGKVKYVCALVTYFVQVGSSGKLVLKDPTGEINATVHKLVLDEYEAELKPGTGLLLKDVSVFSPTPKKHYVNITPTNVVTVFPCVFSEKSTQMHLTQVSEKNNLFSNQSAEIAEKSNFLHQNILKDRNILKDQNILKHQKSLHDRSIEKNNSINKIENNNSQYIDLNIDSLTQKSNNNSLREYNNSLRDFNGNTRTKTPNMPNKTLDDTYCKDLISDDLSDFFSDDFSFD